MGSLNDSYLDIGKDIIFLIDFVRKIINSYRGYGIKHLTVE